MKRQLRPMLTAIALFLAPLAWSQSGSAGGSQAASPSSPQGASTSSSQSTSANPSQGSPAGSSAGTSSSVSNGLYTYPSGTNSPQTLFTSTTPGPGTDAQNGASDPQTGGTDTSQSGAGGPQDTFSHPEKLPALNLFSDVTGHTGLTLSTSVGNITERVSQHDSPSSISNLALLGGGVSVSQYRSNWLWSFDYGAGTNVTNGTYGNLYTSLTQSGSARITWNFAKTWQMRIKDDYTYTDDPFQPYLTYFGDPTPNNPNPVTYIANAIIEQNHGTIEVTHRLAAHDTINLIGGETFQHYIRGAYGQLNNFTYSGGGFYQHDFSARVSAGGGYLFQALDFGHGQSRAGTNLFQIFGAYRFSPRLQISGWVGPQLTHTKDLIPIFCSPYGCLVDIQHRGGWSVAEGGSFHWQVSPTNALGIQVSHQINNGGGLLGIARLYQGALTYTRPISHIWNFNAGVIYSDSLSVSLLRPHQYLKSWAGTAGVGRRLFTDAWSFNAYYAFIRQAQNYTLLPTLASTNGIGLTLSYVWNHSLGR